MQVAGGAGSISRDPKRGQPHGGDEASAVDPESLGGEDPTWEGCLKTGAPKGPRGSWRGGGGSGSCRRWKAGHRQARGSGAVGVWGEGAACWSANLAPNFRRALGSSGGPLPSPRRHVLRRVLAAT